MEIANKAGFRAREFGRDPAGNKREVEG